MAPSTIDFDLSRPGRSVGGVILPEVDIILAYQPLFLGLQS